MNYKFLLNQLDESSNIVKSKEVKTSVCASVMPKPPVRIFRPFLSIRPLDSFYLSV